MAADALDAIALLRADHRDIEELFFKAEREVPGSTAKQNVVAQICQALTIHAQIEEEIAYPAFRQAGAFSDVMDEAAIEHATGKHLIEELQQMTAADDKYDARVRVLSEYVKHHVKEEETAMFQEVDDGEADLQTIGARLIERKRQLMGGTERPAA